eukprot:TRINITY_DN4837_c0_g1_i1.p1 TRINITY_DN4837_c0_g1~~TRINITY_DN4837_c0_g1_i1.p1  ORF type:complete len:335 (-),score=65.45 TRINITY_DN4837_c0_g1_i1:442-1353(-)
MLAAPPRCEQKRFSGFNRDDLSPERELLLQRNEEQQRDEGTGIICVSHDEQPSSSVQLSVVEHATSMAARLAAEALHVARQAAEPIREPPGLINYPTLNYPEICSRRPDPFSPEADLSILRSPDRVVLAAAAAPEAVPAVAVRGPPPAVAAASATDTDSNLVEQLLEANEQLRLLAEERLRLLQSLNAQLAAQAAQGQGSSQHRPAAASAAATAVSPAPTMPPASQTMRGARTGNDKYVQCGGERCKTWLQVPASASLVSCPLCEHVTTATSNNTRSQPVESQQPSSTGVFDCLCRAFSSAST